jgi:hypothetical protein
MAYRITCSTLETLLDEQGRVVSLLHRAGGYEFLSAPAPPVGLWELALIRPVAYDDPLPEVVIPTLPYPGHEVWANRHEYLGDLILDSDSAPPPAFAGDDTGGTLTWELPLPEGIARVVVSIQGGLDRDGLELTATVALPDGWAIKRLTCPRIRGFGEVTSPQDDALLFPQNWGVLRANPLEDMTALMGQYPSAANWCQMIAWLHGKYGLYWAVRDPETNHTGLDARYVEGTEPAPWHIERWHPQREQGSWETREYEPLADRLAAGRAPGMQLLTNHWPEMVALWTSPYPVLLQGFTGDWYTAAQLHRDWARQQRWCRRGRLAERADAPQSLAGLDLWFIRYGFHPGSREPKPAWEFQEAMHALHDYFGMPFGVHWYNWHNFSWHSTYPTHAPVVEGFEEVKNELQARGLVIMPYCQGRILYRDRPDWQSERTHASVEANGQPYLEKYTGGDDWPLALCPGDTWSQAQWYEAARMLWQDYDVDGVYFDQITAMIPSLCYHAGHGHPLGGGRQYWQGYDRALERMAPLVAQSPRRFLSSELFADAFLDRIDLYLGFVPPVEEYVPLFSALYGGYTTAMGRHTPSDMMADPQLFLLGQGEQLLFGGQLGWMNEEILEHPAAAEKLRDLARLRAKVRPFLHLGELEAPLPVEVDGLPLAVTLPRAMTGTARPVRLQRPAILHTAWRHPDGRRLLLLLNETGAEATARLTLPAGWPRGEWRLFRLGSEETEAMTASATLEVVVPGLSAAALVSAAAGP